MAIALVGTIGAASQGAASAAVTPAWGTSENRTAGNLLICTVTVTAVATLPGTPSGWSVAAQVAGTSCSSTIYYKVAAGSDTAPTIAAITSGVIAAQLSEYSGASASPLDRNATSTGTTSPNTATAGGALAHVGELIVMAAADFRSVANTSSDTWTSNQGTPTLAGNNNGTSSVNHYSRAYIASGSATTASTSIVTLSNTSNITGIANVHATFKATYNLVSSAPSFKWASAGTVAEWFNISGGPSFSWSAVHAAGGFSSVVMSYSPTGYWRLGEPSGSTADNFQGNATYDGTYAGSPTLGVAGALTGDSDTAITLNGSSQSVSGAGLALGLGSWSVALLAKWTNRANSRIFQNYSAGYGGGLTIHWDGDHLYAGFPSLSLSAPDTRAGGYFANGAWHHIVATADRAGLLTLYVDGAVEATVNISGGSAQNIPTADNWIVGRRDTNDLWFAGSVDEVAWFPSVLLAADVSAQYAAITAGNPPDLALQFNADWDVAFGWSTAGEISSSGVSTFNVDWDVAFGWSDTGTLAESFDLSGGSTFGWSDSGVLGSQFDVSGGSSFGWSDTGTLAEWFNLSGGTAFGWSSAGTVALSFDLSGGTAFGWSPAGTVAEWFNVSGGSTFGWTDDGTLSLFTIDISGGPMFGFASGGLISASVEFDLIGGGGAFGWSTAGTVAEWFNLSGGTAFGWSSSATLAEWFNLSGGSSFGWSDSGTVALSFDLSGGTVFGWTDTGTVAEWFSVSGSTVFGWSSSGTLSLVISLFNVSLDVTFGWSLSGELFSTDPANALAQSIVMNEFWPRRYRQRDHRVL